MFVPPSHVFLSSAPPPVFLSFSAASAIPWLIYIRLNHKQSSRCTSVLQISYNGKTVASALKVSAANVSLVGEEDNHNFTVTATRADGRQSSATLQARHDVLSRKGVRQGYGQR